LLNQLVVNLNESNHVKRKVSAVIASNQKLPIK